MNNSAADCCSPLRLFPGQLAPRLYDRLVEVLRIRHYCRRSEEAHLLEAGYDIRTGLVILSEGKRREPCSSWPLVLAF